MEASLSLTSTPVFPYRNQQFTLAVRTIAGGILSVFKWVYTALLIISNTILAGSAAGQDCPEFGKPALWANVSPLELTSDNDRKLPGEFENAFIHPGNRTGAFTWTDAENNLWLYGGLQKFSNIERYYDDLWKYVPKERRWYLEFQSPASPIQAAPADYTSSTNPYPGSRSFGGAWIGADGDLYLLGGGISQPPQYFNDIWRYSISQKRWYFISGDTSLNASGVYEGENQQIGSRMNFALWPVPEGIFVYGGKGYASALPQGLLDDLWKWTAATNKWEYVSGHTRIHEQGADLTYPGPRENMCAWKDSNGRLWIAGGNGRGTSPLDSGLLNQVWTYSPQSNQWEFKSGSEQTGNSDNIEVNAATIGGFAYAACWMTPNPNEVMIFGGQSVSQYRDTQNLWKLNLQTLVWTPVDVSANINQVPDYTLGELKVGCRRNFSVWNTSDNFIWIYGGVNRGYNGGGTGLSDLWIYDNSPGSQGLLYTQSEVSIDQSLSVDKKDGAGILSISAQPQNGSATLISPLNNTVSYQSNPQFLGRDTFTVQINDEAECGVKSKPLSVWVDHPNYVYDVQFPETNIMAGKGIDFEYPKQDLDGDANQLEIVESSPGPIIVANVTVPDNLDNLRLTYFAPVTFSGTSTIRYRFTDGKGFSPIRTLTVHVSPPPPASVADWACY